MIIAVISLGILLGIGTIFDIVNTRKRGWVLTRFFVGLLCTSMPAIYKSMVSVSGATPDTMNNLSSVWINYFYVTYLLTMFASVLCVYITICYPLIKRVSNCDSDRFFSCLDLFLNGYENFKKEILSILKEARVQKINSQSEMLLQNSDLGVTMSKYVATLYLTLLKELDCNAYLVYNLKDFVSRFIGQCDARFTIRKLNIESQKMQTFITTVDDGFPGDIDISKPNLIIESLKVNKPLIYSRCKGFHFSTENNSITRGLYDDYVSYCLISKENKPLYSICLDVKGDKAVKRMHSIVDTAIFIIICKAFVCALEKNNID